MGMGMLTLIGMLGLEGFLFVWSVTTKKVHRKEIAIIRIGTLFLFVLLLGFGFYEWSFRYGPFLLLLVIQFLAATRALLGMKESFYGIGGRIGVLARNSLLYFLTLCIAIILPQYEQVATSGNLRVETEKYTWLDTSRVEGFASSGESRALTVDFWFPDASAGTFPLVVFSHGAFGFSGSNYSTFVELASHGYVVASISHTYQAFYTIDTQGKLTTVNPNFLQKAIEVSSDKGEAHEEENYNTTREWMALRIGDENFVLDRIFTECKVREPEGVFSLIDTDRIGLMGHSLGGATSAQLGRERNDIAAVIVLDGTMLGEEVGFLDNRVVLEKRPYPIPILNIYAYDHYTDAKALVGQTYPNFFASQNASIAYETVFHESGHLNFTDLPLFSPILAKLLGVGRIDARYCIETMNSIVLAFFDCYLKDAKELLIEKEY